MENNNEIIKHLDLPFKMTRRKFTDKFLGYEFRYIFSDNLWEAIKYSKEDKKFPEDRRPRSESKEDIAEWNEKERGCCIRNGSVTMCVNTNTNKPAIIFSTLSHEAEHATIYALLSKGIVLNDMDINNEVFPYYVDMLVKEGTECYLQYRRDEQEWYKIRKAQFNEKVLQKINDKKIKLKKK